MECTIDQLLEGVPVLKAQGAAPAAEPASTTVRCLCLPRAFAIGLFLTTSLAVSQPQLPSETTLAFDQAIAVKANHSVPGGRPLPNPSVCVNSGPLSLPN
jgi:hypothetical protein